MRRTVFLIMMVVALSMVTIATAANRYNRPESVIKIPGEHAILIANVGTGTITRLSLFDNKTSVWAKGLNGPKGMAILDGKLYVADETEIKCLDLSNGKILKNIPVSASKFLNDACTDGKCIYVTDMETNKLLKFDPVANEISEFVIDGLESPNGICFDKENNRLLLNSFRSNSPIQAIDLDDGSVSTLLETEKSKLDGIALTSDGNILFSSWETGALYLYKTTKQKFKVLKNGYSGPADFWLDEEAGKIFLPVMMEDRIDIIGFSVE